MKFDYCIGNPPYQVSDGGGTGSSAKPVYQLFSIAAKDVARVNCLIQPSRWMTGGKGLDDYRKEMLNDTHIKVLHDYADSHDLFSNVDIKGGVCIYIRDSQYEGDCKCITHTQGGIVESIRPLCDGDDEVYIREPMLIKIKNKIEAMDYKSLSILVSSRMPYGLTSDALTKPEKYNLSAFSDEKVKDGYKILGLGEKQQRVWKYPNINFKLLKQGYADKYKVFISKAYGCGAIGEVPTTPVLAAPVLAAPGEICTETFLEIGPFETKVEAENLKKYICTKFFRCMVGILKQTQNTSKKVYKYVPIQDFTPSSDIDWSKTIPEIDKQLYKKYNFTKEEIAFIESHVKEMN